MTRRTKKDVYLENTGEKLSPFEAELQQALAWTFPGLTRRTLRRLKNLFVNKR